MAEKLLQFDFVAFVASFDILVESWEDFFTIAHVSISKIMTGYKLDVYSNMNDL